LGLVAEIERDFISLRTKEALSKGIDKRSIAKLLDVSPNTLYAWLKVRRPA
jgi:transposase